MQGHAEALLQDEHDAFLSYRRSDGFAAARWLRRELQDYRLPQALQRSDRTEPLRVYLDRIYERADEDFFANTILPALKAARHLVVIATPDAPKPRADGSRNWMVREIEAYHDTLRKHNLAVVRAKGRCDDPLPGRIDEWYPTIQQVDLSAFSPLEAVWPPLRWRLRDAMLQVVAALHRIDPRDMPALREEEARRQRARLWAVSVTAAALVMIFTVLAVLAELGRREAVRQSLVSDSRRLAMASEAALDGEPRSALKTAIDSVDVLRRHGQPRLAVAEEALRTALLNCGGRPLNDRWLTVTDIVIGAHGRWVATRGRGARQSGPDADRGCALLWDLNPPASSCPRSDLLTRADSIAASPDGRWLATTDADEISLRGLDDDPGASPGALFSAGRKVTAVAVGCDGRLVAGLDDGSVQSWETSGGSPVVGPPRVLAEPTRGEGNVVTALVISPDGRWLATGFESGEARIRDLAAGGPGLTMPERLTSPVASVYITPDGRRVVAVGVGAALLWDRDVGTSAPLQGDDLTVTAVALSADGRWLATGSLDGAGQLFDLKANTRHPAYALRRHSSQLFALAFSPDNHWLVTGGGDHAVWVFDLRAVDPSASPFELRGHDGAITAVAFCADSRTFVTGDEVGHLRRWDLNDVGPVPPPGTIKAHEVDTGAVAFSPNGRWLATGGADRLARLWDRRPNRPTTAAITLPQSGDVAALAFSRDGRFLATACFGGSAHIWDVTTAVAAPHRTLAITGKSITTIAFSPNGRRVATGGGFRDHARLWELTDARTSGPRDLRSDGGASGAIAFSPDGRWLAVGGAKEVWVSAVGSLDAAPIRLRCHTDLITALAFSPDGRRLASADATVALWDVTKFPAPSRVGRAPDPTPIRRLIKHTWTVRSVAFSPDGRWLASGGEEGLAILWNLGVPELADPSVTLPNPRKVVVNAVAFNPDGRELVTAEAGGDVRFWDLQIDTLIGLARSASSRAPVPAGRQ